MSCRAHQVNGVTMIACARERDRTPLPCCACPVKLATLVCDGCDKGLCARCATSPREGVDFCPGCARPLFVAWCTSPEGKRWASGAAALHLTPDALRDLRRNAFRKWSAEHAEKFEQLRTTQSKKHGRPGELPLSVRMLRDLPPTMRVEAELYVSRSGCRFVVVDNTKIAVGTPIADQWQREQLEKP